MMHGSEGHSEVRLPPEGGSLLTRVKSKKKENKNGKKVEMRHENCDLS